MRDTQLLIETRIKPDTHRMLPTNMVLLVLRRFTQKHDEINKDIRVHKQVDIKRYQMDHTEPKIGLLTKVPGLLRMLLSTEDTLY